MTTQRTNESIGKPSPRNQRSKPPRSVRLLEDATADTQGWFAIRLTVGQDSAAYLVRSIPCAIGGLAFEVEKLNDALQSIEQYHVRIGTPQDCSCDCPGFTYHAHCKHVEGLLALDQGGCLPRQKHAACPRCLEQCEGGQLCERCAAEEEDFAAYHQVQEMEAAGLETFPDEPKQLDEAAYFDPTDLS